MLLALARGWAARMPASPGGHHAPARSSARILSRCGVMVYRGSRAEAWPASKMPNRVHADPPSSAIPETAAAVRLRRASEDPIAPGCSQQPRRSHEPSGASGPQELRGKAHGARHVPLDAKFSHGRGERESPGWPGIGQGADQHAHPASRRAGGGREQERQVLAAGIPGRGRRISEEYPGIGADALDHPVGAAGSRRPVLAALRGASPAEGISAGGLAQHRPLQQFLR